MLLKGGNRKTITAIRHWFLFLKMVTSGLGFK